MCQVEVERAKIEVKCICAPASVNILGAGCMGWRDWGHHRANEQARWGIVTQRSFVEHARCLKLHSWYPLVAVE